jgi:4-hydroxybenzoate polyprenyltransferase
MAKDGFIADVISITMPNRSFTACLALVAGMLMAGHFDPVFIVFGVLTCICVYCTYAVFNNICDVEGDKINDPQRPLARGSLSLRFAWTLMATLAVAGVIFSLVVSWVFALSNVLYVFFGVIYSKFTKSMGMLSYMTLVTTHIVTPMMIGYLLFHPLDAKILFAAAFMFVTEIFAFSIKDYKDVEGDRKTGMKTLPVQIGVEEAARITFIGLCLPIAVVWLPWKILDLSNAFLVIYLIAIAIRISFGARLLANPSPDNAKVILNNFRLVLLIQMIAWCFC